MQIETLRTLVESRAYRDRSVREAKNGELNTESLTTALYGVDVWDREAQMEAFCTSEDVKIYALNVWTDSDTGVGLRLIETRRKPLRSGRGQGAFCFSVIFS